MDHLQKRRALSEAAQLNGAVVEQGSNLGLATPSNARIYGAPTAILADPSRRENYRHNPGAVLKC